MRGALAALLLIASTAHGGELHINFYGRSIHKDANTAGLNENNSGYGARWSFNDNTLAEHGEFIDSKSNGATYTAVAVQTSSKRLLSAGLGVISIKSDSYQRGNRFTAALPFLSLNTWRITTTAGYIPRVEFGDGTRTYEMLFFYWSLRLSSRVSPTPKALTQTS